MARLNADGSLDTSFLNNANDGASNTVETIVLQPDGKILVGGAFNSFNGTTKRKIARLNADGSLDNSFVGSNVGATSARVNAIAVQADGKIVIGGTFNSIDQQQIFGMARLNADGTHDTSFSPEAFSFRIEAVIVQPDGRILVGGSLGASTPGVTRRGVARLNTNGSIDTSFNADVTGLGFSVQSMALQPDGKLVIGGEFDTVNGVARNRVSRLNEDGSLDTSFLNNHSGVNRTVEAVAVQPDGKVVIGGFFFSRVNDALRNNVARLKADGSLDETFLNFTSGANRIVYAVALQPDGKVLVGGTFSAVNDVPRLGIARLTNALSPNPIDVPANFVTQHYRDFFSREPDAEGLAFWTNQITSCGTNQGCREVRTINVSAAFFQSIEFQETGYLVYKTYGAAFGTTRVGATVPLTFQEFLPDLRSIGAGVIVNFGNWQQRLEANKVAYFNAFVARPQFVAAYPHSMTPAQFVDALNANTGGSLTQAERDGLANSLGAGTLSRAQVLRAVAENAEFSRREFNRAFVLMQYFGYMRRNPNDPPEPNLDFQGYNFWLTKLNQHNGNFVEAEMVKAFITSGEYRERFGTP